MEISDDSTSGRGRPTAIVLARTQGAEVTGRGVRYRTWADKDKAEVAICNLDGAVIRSLELQPEGDGYFSGLDAFGHAGDLYRYGFGGESYFPDPASRWQPFGVHGPSMVIDPGNFPWTDAEFCCPHFKELVIYELHIGTFTKEGTFAAAINSLRHIADLGVTALELLPVADFSGDRNWGYDGVALYAPARTYGHPDDLRALVNAAHAYGLAVILDVVYNHLGPDGNYVGAYHRHYFDSRQKTPWGDALNYGLAPVRQFFVENAPYWRNEFHFDGFRLDATHAIKDSSQVHILAEITEAIHACGAFAVAEDDRRSLSVLKPANAGGLGFDGCWADDFHHIIHVMLTSEREGYYGRYLGQVRELAEVINRGWLSDVKSGEVDQPESSQFVFTLSNHDQVGNRAFGERLGHLTSPAAYRAASTLLCFAPQTPLLFMGQEWNCSSPFQFFTHHNAKLGKAVTEGRRNEFCHFSAFNDKARCDTIPDPQAEDTFLNSKLLWAELTTPEHSRIFHLYAECLRLRRANIQIIGSEKYTAHVVGESAIAILFDGEECRLVVVADLDGSLRDPLDPLGTIAELIGADFLTTWDCLLSSNETRFGGSCDGKSREPQTVVLKAKSSTESLRPIL